MNIISMSYIKKRQRIQNEKSTVHNDLSLEEYDEKHVFVKLLNTEYKDYWDDNLYDVNAIWKKKGWIVNRNNLDKLKVIMNMNYESDEDKSNSDDEKERKSNKNSKNSKNNKQDYSDEESDSSSSTDDELIQKALARRLMSESTRKSIEDEAIEDSELEDVVSVCRRFRFLYSEIKRLRHRVSELEKRI